MLSYGALVFSREPVEQVFKKRIRLRCRCHSAAYGSLSLSIPFNLVNRRIKLLSKLVNRFFQNLNSPLRVL